MAEVPELPEANDPFERTIALTIAVIAVVLSLVENHGDNAKTDAIVKNTAASNQWAYYQSKSLKENLAETTATLLGSLAPGPDAAAVKAKATELQAEVKRYDQEKNEIKAKAEALGKEVDTAMALDDVCDLASLVLQISVVICSISILVRWKPIFFAGMTSGIVGVVLGIKALLS